MLFAIKLMTPLSKISRRIMIIGFVILLSLIIPKTLSAAPEKDLKIDKDIQLAMLDLSRQTTTKLSGFTNKRSHNSMIFPKNCLQWNAYQINQKASKHNKSILKYARQYRIDSNLIKSVIAVESCFKVKALSSAGAKGLMQLIPATAKRFGVKNSYNSQHNIRGGVKYLRFLLDRYNGNLSNTLAAYNAGEGKVDQYKGIPPYKETRLYVKNVLKVYKLLNPNLSFNNGRVKAVYYPHSLVQKPGRSGWKYNRQLAPHLYKQ